ncbi:Pre-mRNA-processing factor 17 [Thelohanellus kitauei]|uniref:Pre-mRNA-processing factor 17 n=1 Tax=Thelohanellus kitauei TaxID=669202 RepID=A0A0C2MIF6_THEKT|nr:Pre-mRNA-processing factor 17 [Thelohanellus kitauei]
MELIKGYDSDESSDLKLDKDIKSANSLNMVCDSAPKLELTQNHERKRFYMNPNDRVVLYNPKYDELYAPVVGPTNPFKTKEQKSTRNVYTGLVEPATVNDTMFDNQRITFHHYGYSVDPSIDKSSEVIGDKDALINHEGKTVAEMKPKKKKSTRKREDRGTAEDVESFKGPWAAFVDEVRSSRPNDEQMEILHQWIKEKLAKKEIVKKQEEPEIVSESSILHLPSAVDYQARSFMVPPQDIGVNFRSDDPPERCYLPTKHLFTWRGHTKGITVVRTIPNTGHLLLTGSQDCTIKLWESYKERRLVMTYRGHRDPIKDLCFANDGRRYLSCSLDRFIKLWDTETGSCLGRFTTNKVPNCVRFNPDDDKQNLFIAGMADKKMVTWDINAHEIVQEYDRHLGAVNSITFIENNQRIFTTSEDRTLRVWEWDIPVDSKYIADPGMHVMPSVTLSPDGRYLACQSLDNKIVIYDVENRVREKRRKVFRGHVLQGNHSQVFFSPDQRYVLCGDGEGKVSIWNFKTTKLLSRYQAHEKAIISVSWLPHETSKVITTGLDGLMKMWD